jgi:protein required for attachment to host cells
VSDSVTWILTADDWNAQIHVSRDGLSTLLRTVRNRTPERMVRQADSEAPDFAEFRALTGLAPARPRDTHLCFAHELLWLLSEEAEAYDGLIIMATPAMLDALTSIGAPRIRDKVIAEIVMNAPIGNPIEEVRAPRESVAA